MNHVVAVFIRNHSVCNVTEIPFCTVPWNDFGSSVTVIRHMPVCRGTGHMHWCRNWLNCIPSWNQGIKYTSVPRRAVCTYIPRKCCLGHEMEISGVKQFFSICLHSIFCSSVQLELSWPWQLAKQMRALALCRHLNQVFHPKIQWRH